jgi:hypothetical protein
MTDDTKALSYIPQIRQAYKELIATNESKLRLAINLGQLLNSAKETVKGETDKGDRKWMKFRETHFDEISHRTATVYMSLAKAFGDSEDWQHAANLMTGGDSRTNGDLSIRAAIELMHKANGGGVTTPTRTPRTPKTPTTDPERVIPDVEPDDVAKIVSKSWDRDKQDRLLTQQLKPLTPVQVYNLLLEAWGDERLQELAEGILKSKNKETEDDLPPAKLQRRPAPAEARPQG